MPQIMEVVQAVPHAADGKDPAVVGMFRASRRHVTTELVMRTQVSEFGKGKDFTKCIGILQISGKKKPFGSSTFATSFLFLGLTCISESHEAVSYEREERGRHCDYYSL